LTVCCWRTNGKASSNRLFHPIERCQLAHDIM
jgi:hypothetical protein